MLKHKTCQSLPSFIVLFHLSVTALTLVNFLPSVVPWLEMLCGKEQSTQHGDSTLQLCTQVSSKTMPTWGLAHGALTQWALSDDFDLCCHKRLGPSEFSEVAGCADSPSSRHLLKGRTEEKKHFQKTLHAHESVSSIQLEFCLWLKTSFGLRLIVKGASSVRLLYCVVSSGQHSYKKSCY